MINFPFYFQWNNTHSSQIFEPLKFTGFELCRLLFFTFSCFSSLSVAWQYKIDKKSELSDTHAGSLRNFVQMLWSSRRGQLCNSTISDGALTLSLILCWSLLPCCAAPKVYSFILYTYLLKFIPITNCFHCSLFIHFTFTSLSSSVPAWHACWCPASHSVHDLSTALPSHPASGLS